MTIEVLIDSLYLKVTREEQATDQLKNFVQKVLDLLELTENPDYCVYRSNSMETLLWELGVFPDLESLRQLVDRSGCREYSLAELSRLVELTLRKTKSLDSAFGMGYVLAENFKWREGGPESLMEHHVREDLEQFLDQVAVLDLANATSGFEHILVCDGVTRGRNGFVTSLLEIDPPARPPWDKLKLPRTTSKTSILGFRSVEELYSSFDPAVLFASATTAEQFERAIGIALSRASVQDGPYETKDSAASPRLSTEFVPSVLRWRSGAHKDLSNALLDVILDAVLGRKLPQVHALRTSKGGDSAGRTRGSDKAMRRDVDAGMRLHYWELPGRRVELAKIVSHDDFTIPS